MQHLPSTDDLLRVMTVLGIPGDPRYIMKDHVDERRRAELLAHIAAAVTERLEALETLAGLDVDDRADLHWRADRAAAGGERPDRLLAARLAWAQHVVARERGRRADPVAEAVATTLGVVISLLQSPDAGADAPPMVADAVLGLYAAADHLAAVLRAAPREAV